MKLAHAASAFLAMGIGIAGLVAVEAAAERARTAPLPVEISSFQRIAGSERAAGVEPALAGAWRILGAAGPESGGYAPFSGAIAAAARLEIATDGSARATVGCNTIATRVSQSGSDWNAGPAAATRMACPQPGVMEAEQAVGHALSEATAISLDGDRAELADATGATLMVLERE
jgi:heat shock protein HslJ